MILPFQAKSVIKILFNGLIGAAESITLFNLTQWIFNQSLYSIHIRIKFSDMLALFTPSKSNSSSTAEVITNELKVDTGNFVYVPN